MSIAILWVALASSIAVFAQTGSDADRLVREGRELARQGRLEEAEATLRQGRTQHPNDARFALELAGVRYLRKDLTGARQSLHAALRLEPQNAYGNEFLGSLYLMDGNLPAALRYWNRMGQPVVGAVLFVPALPLDPVMLARLPGVSAGQVLTEDRLARTAASLRSLGISADSRFRLDARADRRYNFTIQTEPLERTGGRWWWQALPYLRSLPYEAVNVDFFNIGKKATHFTSLWRWDAEKRRIASELSGQASGTIRYRLALDARDERWDLRRTYNGEAAALDGVELRSVAGGGEAIVPLGVTTRWTSGLFVSGRQYRNIGNEAGAWSSGGWLAEMRNRLEGRVAFWPEQRLRVDGWASLRSGRFLSGAGGKRFVSPSGGLQAQWFPQARGERYEVNLQTRAGGAYGRVPLDEMFLLGMERDNPLWLRGHVGTRSGRKGNAPLGSQFFLVNADVQRELWRVLFLRVQAGPFFDVGATRDPGGSFGSRGLIYDTGLQVTLHTMRGIRISAVYGRDLRNGRPAIYTAVSR
ncbi:MAG: tetratricopeptide repeat protein [Bryobacterales bacterium]|nr:tetratricopeptide repeat protein [Bryobacterales bacterium]